MADINDFLRARGVSEDQIVSLEEQKVSKADIYRFVWDFCTLKSVKRRL